MGDLTRLARWDAGRNSARAGLADPRARGSEGAQRRYGWRGYARRVELKKWQRNEIFDAVRERGLSPEQFGWDVGADESTLRHQPSGAYFVFGGDSGDYTSRYVAGDSPLEERTGLNQYRLMEQVNFWLMAIKMDVEMPDLWAQVQGEAELFRAISDATNTPLTPAEQHEIARQLRELADHIGRTYTLSEPQTRLLEERVEYLTDATTRVGRKDWLFMAGGAMLSYVLEAALPPDAARDVVGEVLRSIWHILGQGPLGLPGA